MTKITMLRDAKAAPEGHTVRHYAEGHVYDVPAWLADAFVADGFAEAAAVENKRQDTPAAETKPAKRKRKG